MAAYNNRDYPVKNHDKEKLSYLKNSRFVMSQDLSEHFADLNAADIICIVA